MGLTFGRHLSIFEMGGHHAFNKEGQWIYWKDETVDYALEFFAKEIGVPEDEITLKESWWEGGGNAGPCFEVVSGGLELATLVFMQYRSVNGGYEPIPLKVVDTGYGIERIAWFTQKTPTAFHAVYGGLVDALRSRLGLSPPEKGLLEAIMLRVGRLRPQDPQSVDEVMKRVAMETGLGPAEVKATYLREARLYSVLDHSKTLAFMLADGIVPSNQGEGYLARLVLRRALKQLLLLDADPEVLVWLVEKQVDLWGDDFPTLEERRDYVIEASSLETRRFLESLRSNMEKALSVLSRPSSEALRKVYEEYGIPPEVLAQEARKRGIEVEVPQDFYSRLAKEGSTRRAPQEPLRPELLDVPRTRLLFHENPYATATEALVLRVASDGLVFDRTVFYPEGGGQASDTGWVVTSDGRRLRVSRVVNHDGRVLHILADGNDLASLREGERVLLVIDWERRFNTMRHHTATHILLGALRKVLGYHAWQAGAEKTPEKGRLDVTHHKPLSNEEVKRIEDLANGVVNARIPLNIRTMDRNEAEERFGFSIYQGGAPPSGELRIVEIPGHDVQACFGTHVLNTGEVGGIKIVSVKKIQDGVYRLEYVAGSEVASYARTLESRLAEALNVIGGAGDLVDRIRGVMVSNRALRDLVSRYRRLAMRLLKEELKRRSYELEPLTVYLFEDEVGDKELATRLLLEIVGEDPKALVIRVSRTEGTEVEVSCGSLAASTLPAHAFAKALAGTFGGKGGGKESHSYVRVPGYLRVDEILEVLEGLLRRARPR